MDTDTKTDFKLKSKFELSDFKSEKNLCSSVFICEQ